MIFCLGKKDCIGNRASQARSESHGQLRLESPADTNLSETDTYYKVSGNFIDGDANGFEVVDNKLKYIRDSGICFLLNGVSDLQVNKACTITYSLFKNGVLVPGAQTPHTFVNPSKTSNISITAICKLDKNDELEVFAKSDEINTIISVHTLNDTLWGSI